MSVTKLKGFWTLSQCVDALDGAISEWTLRREIREGRLIAQRIGRCVRVTEEELDRWRLERGRTEAVAS